MTSCAIPGRPHRAEAGLLLCRAHLDEAAEWLHDVEREADLLDARPSMAVVFDHGGGLASHRAPARLDPIVQADRRRVPLDRLTTPAGVDGTLSVFDTLHRYATLVRDGRGLTLPTRFVRERIGRREGPICADGLTTGCQHTSCRRMTYCYRKRPELTVATERAILTRHLDWAAAQPWAPELWADLRTLRGQLQRANGTADPGPIPGRCPRLVDGVECGGRLWPAKPVHTSGELVHAGEEVVQAIECDRHSGHRWEGRHLIRLALILDQQQGKSA